jgi:hypothetical protein
MKNYLITLCLVFACLTICAQKSERYDSDIITYEYVIDDKKTNYAHTYEKSDNKKYLEEKGFIDVAYKHLNKGEYAIAEIWARRTCSFKELYYHRYYILTIATAKMKQSSKFRMYYKRLKKYSTPEQLKEIDKQLVEIGMVKEKTSNFF